MLAFRERKQKKRGRGRQRGKERCVVGAPDVYLQYISLLFFFFFLKKDDISLKIYLDVQYVTQINEACLSQIVEGTESDNQTLFCFKV